MSPESPEPDDSYTLTPRTEAKYNKIDEDFQMMMQRNQQISANRAMGNNYTLPVSVPVGSYNDGNLLQASPQMAHQNISPRPSSSETDSGECRERCALSYGSCLIFVPLFSLPHW
jgi:MADS-box transcription enhancer factor 2A